MSNTDLLDPDLCGMFKPGHVEDLTAKPSIPKKKPNPVDTSFPSVKGKPSETDKVKALALSIFPYAVMSSVVFWWQQSGLLHEETGFYALIVLALLAGLSVGRAATK